MKTRHLWLYVCTLTLFLGTQSCNRIEPAVEKPVAIASKVQSVAVAPKNQAVYEPGSVEDWRAKAVAGDVEAQMHVANIYGLGDGVPKDDAEAVKWIRKAAEQGNAEAQAGLAGMYQAGKMVPKDDAEAIKWARKAAEQGYVEAQLLLGLLYRFGEGIQQDLVQAHAWINIAAASGDEKAQSSRENLEAHLTSEQKAAATKLARELFVKLPKAQRLYEKPPK